MSVAVSGGLDTNRSVPSAPPVLVRTLRAAQGGYFGHLTLNSPATLNCLSLDMIRIILPALRAWADDADAIGLILDAAGEKAFCAGGDLRQLYREILDGPPQHRHAEAFFGEEYALDYLIHTYPKPVLAWGHGIAMGGGVGLMVGASHRVVTDSTVMAMPEISVGLYPDVGGSWFLRRMPGQVGLFLALTGARLNAADALFCGLADTWLPHAAKEGVLAAIAAANWGTDAADNRGTMTRLLASCGNQKSSASSEVRAHLDVVNTLFSGDDLGAIYQRVSDFRGADAWLQKALPGFANGSPTSAAVVTGLWRMTKRMSLAEVLRLEFGVSVNMCAQPDLAEGIRAVLIDKSRDASWSPASIAELVDASIARILKVEHRSAHLETLA
jgi:enoyl-CoA hydratase/carnithine racemase